MNEYISREETVKAFCEKCKGSEHQKRSKT